MDKSQSMSGAYLTASSGEGTATALKQLAKVLEGNTGFVLVGIARYGEEDSIINIAGGVLNEADLHNALESGLQFCKQLRDTPVVENNCNCPKCQARRQKQTVH